MNPENRGGLSIVIPTFRRESILLETIERVLKLHPEQFIVVDQTPDHEPATTDALEKWAAEGRIELLRLTPPSIPRAMNLGVQRARGAIVLFLDDDVVPSGDLLRAHAEAYASHPETWAVVGQVLQPGEEPESPEEAVRFSFRSNTERWISRAIACNFSIRRQKFLECGGFDENFVKVAYCFETEFAERLIRAGGRVLFEPKASIHHLRADRGGTRAHGHHLTTATHSHSVGAYYYFLLNGAPVKWLGPALHRLFRSIATRHHLRRPWWIPVTLFAEVSGLVCAIALKARGPRLLKS